MPFESTTEPMPRASQFQSRSCKINQGVGLGEQRETLLIPPNVPVGVCLTVSMTMSDAAVVPLIPRTSHQFAGAMYRNQHPITLIAIFLVKAGLAVVGLVEEEQAEDGVAASVVHRVVMAAADVDLDGQVSVDSHVSVQTTTDMC